MKFDAFKDQRIQSPQHIRGGRPVGVLVKANSGAPGAGINVLVRGQGSI